jgi:hypothetical protein
MAAEFSVGFEFVLSAKTALAVRVKNRLNNSRIEEKDRFIGGGNEE